LVCEKIKQGINNSSAATGGGGIINQAFIAILYSMSIDVYFKL